MTLRKEKILELQSERVRKHCTVCRTSYRGAMDLSQNRLTFDVMILRNRKYVLRKIEMIWYDTIWYDMIWYDMIWYDMIYDICYDVMWCDVVYMIWYGMIYTIWYDVMWYDVLWYDIWYDKIRYDLFIYLFTACPVTFSNTTCLM